MNQTDKWPEDLEPLKEVKDIPPLKKKAVDPVTTLNEKVIKLEKRIDSLEKLVHNQRIVIEKQILNIKKLNKNLKQEGHDRAYGNLGRQKTVS